MKQWILNWLLKDINRFEIINHSNDKYSKGRVIVHKKIDFINSNDNYKILSSLQDNNKTLKIFI